MSVNNRFNVRSFLIYSHVHLDFGRGFESFVCLDNLSVFVHFADELGSHEALRNARGGAKELMIVELDGNVSVVCGNHPLIVDSLADVANLFLDFKFVYHICLLEVLVCIFDFIIRFVTPSRSVAFCLCFRSSL